MCYTHLANRVKITAKRRLLAMNVTASHGLRRTYHEIVARTQHSQLKDLTMQLISAHTVYNVRCIVVAVHGHAVQQPMATPRSKEHFWLEISDLRFDEEQM